MGINTHGGTHLDQDCVSARSGSTIDFSPCKASTSKQNVHLFVVTCSCIAEHIRENLL